MYKSKLILTVLLAAAILALFGGCQVQNFDIPTEPSAFSQPTESTEPSGELTEPSNETIEPIETVCPRTIAFFKSHLEPYMTYGEAKQIFGRKDTDRTNRDDRQDSIWYLEDDHYLVVEFISTVDETKEDYLSTAPTDDLFYFFEWFNNMVAYRATLYRKSATGKHETVEVWFDYGDHWFPKE